MEQTTFRKAKESDIENILAVCKDIVDYMLNDLQIQQWDRTYPNEEVFKDDIKKEELYLLEDTNENLLGFICINKQVYDAYNEVTWKEDTNFKVLHRVAINPKFHSKGYGTKLYESAFKEIKELGYNYVRVDTFSENIPMNSLIKKVDFNFIGQMNLKINKPPWNCYEKEL